MMATDTRCTFHFTNCSLKNPHRSCFQDISALIFTWQKSGGICVWVVYFLIGLPVNTIIYSCRLIIHILMPYFVIFALFSHPSILRKALLLGGKCHWVLCRFQLKLHVSVSKCILILGLLSFTLSVRFRVIFKRDTALIHFQWHSMDNSI